MNNLLRKVMERTANLRSTSERRMEEVKIGVLPKTGLGINVLASDAVHRVIAARAFGVRVTLPHEKQNGLMSVFMPARAWA